MQALYHDDTAAIPDFTDSQASLTERINSPPSATTPPSNLSAPSISGNTTQGQMLTESHGSWSNGPTSFSYQWEDCDSAGNGCAAIAGATSQTYTLAPSDVGHTVRVSEAASNAGGTSGPVSSAATGVVQAAPAEIKALLLSQLSPTGKGAKIGTLLKRGVFALAFKALEAGNAAIGWYQVPPGAHLAKSKAKPVLVAAGQLRFAAAGTKTMMIKLTAAGKRLLKHSKRLKLTAKGTFTPTGQPAPAISALRTFTLKR